MDLKRLVVASNNPVKVNAARKGFLRMFPGTEFELSLFPAVSGVSVQPSTDGETLLGAENRATHARLSIPDADYWVGIEGGIHPLEGEITAFAWVVIQSANQTGRARTGAFFLPHEVVRLLKQGKELGEADDIVFGRSNSKQGDGAIGILTGNVIDRAALYEQAVILALVPFTNPDYYS